MNEYEKELKAIEGKEVKVKCIIQSVDGGKTWWIIKQFYCADDSEDRDRDEDADNFIEANFEQLPLKTDFEYLEQRSKKNE